MLRAVNSYLLLFVCALIVLLNQCELISAEQQIATNSKNDLDEQQAFSGPRGKFILMPSALSKFLLYNARPSERQAISGYSSQGNALSSSPFKRLDSLSGITIGKRSPNYLDKQQSMEFVNWEPVGFSRQYNNMHSFPRLYDFRLIPSDSSVSSSESLSAQDN